MTTAKLKGPENHGGFSHDGVSYEPDADGVIEVPHEAVGAAFSHGFTLVPSQPANPAAGGDKQTDLTKLKKGELLALAKDKLGLELDAAKTNKELIAEIEAAVAAQAAA